MKSSKIRKNIIQSILYILISSSLVCVFLFGKYATTTNLDVIATNQKNVLRESNANYLGLYVRETTDNPLPNHEKQFFTNYATFRQDLANFIPGINVEKGIDVFFNEIDIPKSLSFFYFGPIKSDSTNKDFIYPMQYMFPSVKKYPKNRFVINISKSQADLLLEKRGIDKTTDGYYSLLYTQTNIKVDGVDYDFQIGNIFLEDNTYFKATKEMLDEFVMVSYYYPSVLTREYIYLLNDNDFQNKYYMDYLVSTYSRDKNLLFVNHNNLNSGIDDSSLLRFYYEDLPSQNGIAITALCISSLVCLCAVLVLCFYFKAYKKWYLTLIFLFSTFLPFIIFKIIFETTNNRNVFSSFSTNANAYICVFLILIYLMFLIVYLIKNKKSDGTIICSNV